MPKWIGATLFALFLVLALNLRQRDLEFMVEPDFFWEMIHAFARFFQSGRLLELPFPSPHVYLDGSHIIYALFDIALRQVTTLPNDMSYALGAAMIANAIAYAAACTIFYAAVRMLTGSTIISAFMAVGLFLAPQIISINLGRLDFLIMLPLMIVFYCSCAITCGTERTRHAIWLGIGMALASTFKINGLVYGLLPACAVVAARRIDRPMAKFALISLLVFAATYLMVMFRYLNYLSPAQIIENYRTTIAVVNDWNEMLRGSWSYYNFELLKDAGYPFIVLYIACAAATLAHAMWHRSTISIFLILAFLGYSALGVATLKYSRGGYHLLPIMFAMIGFVAARLLYSPNQRALKWAAFGAAALLYVASFKPSVATYAKAVQDRQTESIILQAVKREPRDWLKSNVPSGTNICIQTSSVWSIPPLDGYVIDEKMLALPYLDSQKLAKAAPPSLTDVKSSCPIVVTSDLHRDLYSSLLTKASTETAGKWATFFDLLAKSYPPKEFKSPAKVYVKRVDIFDLRKKPNDQSN
jgi:hypothetical protein